VRWIKKLMGREQHVQHTPAKRSEWEKLILRLEIDSATKLVALAAAIYGNPDGSNVGPSVPRLAAELGWSEKHVQNQLSKLRDLGLLEVTRRHSIGKPVRYQLTEPADGTDSLPMRTDEKGYPLAPRKRGRGGRKPALTGTPVPVEEAPDQNSSSGDDQNWSSGEEASEEASTGTGVPVTERSPELEFQTTGTGVPNHRNSSSPDPYKTNTKTNPVVTETSPPTSDRGREDGAEIDRRREALREARTRVAALDPARRDVALAEAMRLLAAEGIRPTVSKVEPLAAHLLRVRGAISTLRLAPEHNKAYLEATVELDRAPAERRLAAETEAVTELRGSGVTGDEAHTIHAGEIVARWNANGKGHAA
jgi:DNA-binding HxlR family transcriptional regulator